MGSKSGDGDVVLRDFDGNLLSSQPPDCINHLRWHLTLTLVLGFWQYGQMDWGLYYGCLNTIILSAVHSTWAVFHYEEDAPGKKGAICVADRNEYPAPGIYILLTPGIHLIFIIGYLTSLMFCRW